MKIDLPKALLTIYKDYIYRINHYSDRISADLDNEKLYFVRGKFLLTFHDKLKQDKKISPEIRLSFFEQAITDFSKALELNYKFIGAYYYRGLCFYNSVFYYDDERHRWKLYMAIEDFTKIIALGDIKIREYDGYIEHSHFDLITQAYLLRGKCYQIQGHLYEYFKDLESLIDIEPSISNEELLHVKKMHDRLRSSEFIRTGKMMEEIRKKRF